MYSIILRKPLLDRVFFVFLHLQNLEFAKNVMFISISHMLTIKSILKLI